MNVVRKQENMNSEIRVIPIQRPAPAGDNKWVIPRVLCVTGYSAICVKMLCSNIMGKPKDYIGHAMDKGARIQSQARRNQILIDEIMYGLIHTKIRDYSADILIGAPNNITLKGVGVSTLYEVSPRKIGLESGMAARMRNLFR